MGLARHNIIITELSELFVVGGSNEVYSLMLVPGLRGFLLPKNETRYDLMHFDLEVM